jgi:hypothetical protein
VKGQNFLNTKINNRILFISTNTGLVSIRNSCICMPHTFGQRMPALNALATLSSGLRYCFPELPNIQPSHSIFRGNIADAISLRSSAASTHRISILLDLKHRLPHAVYTVLGGECQLALRLHLVYYVVLVSANLAFHI